MNLFGALNDFVVDVCDIGHCQREKIEIEERVTLTLGGFFNILDRIFHGLLSGV